MAGKMGGCEKPLILNFKLLQELGPSTGAQCSAYSTARSTPVVGDHDST